MAANTSFKVQCPSCEALVPIRDPNLVGKRIDCPKCKYRFVVEDPNGDEEADDRPARKGAARKPGARPKKKAGSNNMVILGAILGVVALAVLGVVGYLMIGGESKPTASTPPPSGGVPTPSTSGGTPAPAFTRGTPTPAIGGGTATEGQATDQETERAAGADISNLMPPDSAMVLSLHMDRLRVSTPGQQAFESRVGFRPETFKTKVGLGVDEMAQLLHSENRDQGWSFNVLRAGHRVSVEDFEGPLGLTKGPKSPIQGRDYYTLAPNDLLDHLGTVFHAELDAKETKEPPNRKPSTTPLAFLLYDSTTVLIATQDALEEFLQNGSKFQQQSRTTAARNDQPARGDRNQPPAGGDDRGFVPPRVASSGGGGGAEPPSPATGGGQPGGRGRGRGNRGGGQFSSRSSFLTIEPNLKAMLDHLESGGSQVILTMAQRIQADGRIVERIHLATGLRQIDVSGTDVFGFALYQLDSEKLHVEAGVRFFRDTAAQVFEQEMRQALPAVATLAGLYLGGLRVDVGGATGGNRRGNAAGGGGAASPPEDRPSVSSSGGAVSADGAPAGGGGAPGQNQPARSTMGLSRQGLTVFVDADLSLTERAYERVYGLSESTVVRLKGMVDMADGHARWHELAAAGVALRKDGSYPRGTFPRDDTVGSRLSRNWPPSSRVGWMVTLLPYLGQDELYQRIDKKKSWRDEVNLKEGSVLIPQFLNPFYARQSWRASVPSLGLRDQGATHFVGVGGVGIDAADYSANDPAVAKKLGIFGYDRQTRVDDITDGLSNTMYMIQVPPTLPRPWIAGGGATITGVPETGSVKPFVATQSNGRRGTYALMADGTVRFISESISDEVFKAMATTKGGESIDDLDQKAPRVDPPKRSELKTGPGASGGSGNSGGGR